MKRFSVFYWCVGITISLAVRIFYRRRKIVGKSDIRLSNPIIFSPNHQNAFMDALVTTVPIHHKNQLSFMVRQDVFSSKIASFWLKRLMLFPAYRMRDGYENLAKNNETFEHCFNLLEHGKGIIIFPEANHAVIRKLRPLKKGLMRVAFGAQERIKDQDVLVVPVGINYTEPQNFGSELLLIYGEAIEVRDYYDLYEENPVKANLALKDRLEEVMRPLIIDIRDKDYYEEIEEMLLIGTNHFIGRKKGLLEKFQYQKNLIDTLEKNLISEDQNIKTLVSQYKLALSKTGLRDWVFDLEKVSTFGMTIKLFLLLLFSPLFLVGSVLNYLPFMIPSFLARKFIQDEGFKSSIKIAAAVGLFPLWYIIITLISLFFVPENWMLALVVPLAITTGLVALIWIRSFNRTFALLKFSSLKRKRDKSWQEVSTSRAQIIEFIKRSTQA